MADSMSRRRAGFVAAAIAVFVPAAAIACRCVPMTPAAAYRAADAVALVEVQAVSDRDPRARSYRLLVSESWKQRLPAAVVVRTMRTSCLADLAPGGRYLVYLERSATGLSTEACSGNLPADRAVAALAALRKGRA